jgi:hypothetical protein
LLAEMRKNTAEFNRQCINTIDQNASLIPSAFYADIKAKERIDALELVVEAIANFYVNPSPDNYNALVGISARTLKNARPGNIAYYTNKVYDQVLKNVWDELYTRISKQVTEGAGRNLPALSRYPADPRYEVFDRN